MRLLSTLVGILSRICIPKVLREPLYGCYSRFYEINSQELSRPYAEYASFQDFFTRELKSSSRPISSAPIISPVDGKIVDFGYFSNDKNITVKSFPYLLCELIPNKELSQNFIEGFYIILYLSPKDYHRIHSPVTGIITSWIGYQGELKTVNPKQGDKLPHILVHNERVISMIEDNASRKLAVVKVGATNVGSISLTKAKIKSERPINPFKKYYPEQLTALNIPIEKGEELARFNLGSTVVLCFQKGMISSCGLEKGQSIKMGQDLALSSFAKASQDKNEN